MNVYKLVIVLILILGGLQSNADQSKTFKIITASYNNSEWYQKNLLSLFVQNYRNWHLIYIDDCSTDGTAQLVEDFVKEHAMDHYVTIVKNKERRGHLANQYDAIHACNKDEIIVILDGDDWFAHDGVLSYLNTIYQDPDVWLTYGQFWYWKRNKKGICKPLPQDILRHGKVRTHRPFTTSHVRTFYAGLYQGIDLQDLCYQNDLLPMCVDVATMMPMIEMAGTRIRYIDDILYIYNDSNRLSFFHDRRKQQEEIESFIRQKPAYHPLHAAPWAQGS
ncbi:hypothetical protein Noda2021_00630 [Candidatus Dependentiae bacterium Noda2021]|nr:hypothetical protein Noda2021_00630 [Candidatus Dependentiae bacterium Noda2021]